VTPRRTCQNPSVAGTPSDPLEWFRAMGMYQSPLGGGWHAVTCPWIDEHTDRADTGTAYSEPCADNAYWGGFVCHHGHCRHRRGIREVFAWIKAIRQEVRA
jgi:hypothetical protein